MTMILYLGADAKRMAFLAVDSELKSKEWDTSYDPGPVEEFCLSIELSVRLEQLNVMYLVDLASGRV